MNMIVSSAAMIAAAPHASAKEVAAPAVTLEPARDLTADDRRVIDLWERRYALRSEVDRLCRAERRAERRLPWWAREGYSRLCADGTFDGAITQCPADPDALRPATGSKVIRMTTGWARQQYDQAIIATWFGREPAEQLYKQRLSTIAKLERMQEAENARVGLTAVTSAITAVFDRLHEFEDEIEATTPTSPHVAAARLILAATWQCSIHDRVANCQEIRFASIGLTALRRDLTGRLRLDVDEIVDHPERKVAKLGAVVGLRGTLGRKQKMPATLTEARALPTWSGRPTRA